MEGSTVLVMLMSLTNSTSNRSGNNTEYTVSDAGNNDNVYKSYLLYTVTFYMTEYHLWLVLAFGVPGNIASAFTILSMSTVSTSKAHVAILALTDTVAIITKVTYWQASGHRIRLTVPGCRLIMFVQQFSTVYANWVVVVMTSERFLAVWFPFRVGRMYTRRKAFVILACLALTTIAVYAFFFWSWTEHYEDGYGYWCAMKNEYIIFIKEIFYWIDGFYYAILPCALILVGNALIITNIKRAMKAQRHLTNSFDQGGRHAHDQRQITLMLVIVSVTFLLLNLPLAIFYIIKPYWTFPKPSYDEVKYMFSFRFTHAMADSNHAINFYLYFLSMSSFRRRFMSAIRCRFNTRRRYANGTVTRTSHTFLQIACHSGSRARKSSNSGCSPYTRASSSNRNNAQPMKTFRQASNKTSYGQPAHDDFKSVSDISDV